MDERKRWRNNLLVRIGGLFCVSLIGIMIISCGLALSFGDYTLSMIFFFILLAMLIIIKIVIRFLN